MPFKMTLNFPRDWTRIRPGQDHRQTAHVILIWSSGCQFQRSDQWPAPFTQALIRRVMLCLFWATSMLSTPAQFGQWSVHTPIQSPQALPMSLIYQLTTLDNLYSYKAFDECDGKVDVILRSNLILLTNGDISKDVIAMVEVECPTSILPLTF